jgi:hypothetical protein
VTFPTSPPVNCEFTFETDTPNFLIDFNGQSATLPGYEGIVTKWTIPEVAAFRTPYPALTLQFNGTFWEQSGVSSPIYHTAVQPTNASQFAHGQVYFRWDSSTSRFELCPQYGPGGLIVDGQMRQVPSDCLTVAQPAGPGLDYFYAVRVAGDTLSVSNASLDPSGKILLTFATSVLGNINDQVGITCHSIGGALPANVRDAGRIVTASQIELLNASSAGWNSYTTGGTCILARLAALTTGHVTSSNGVEVNTNDAHYTLVGLAYIGASNAVNDSLTQRDVASWFNPKPKKMLVSCNATMTTASPTLKTPSVNTCEGEFVVFAEPQGSPAPAVRWSINSGISNSASTAPTGNVTACFGTSSLSTATACGNAPEAETGTASLFSPGKIMPIGISGMTSTLSEGRNFMDLLGDTSGGTMTFLTTATNNDTTIGAILMQ